MVNRSRNKSRASRETLPIDSDVVISGVMVRMRALSLGRLRQLCKQRRVGADAPLGHGDVVGIEFYPDAVALQPVSDEPGGAGAEEGIEHSAAEWAASEDAWLDERW